jgi:hypothetical protein
MNRPDLKRITGEPGTISAKPEYVYQTDLRKRLVEKQSANRDTTKSVRQTTAQKKIRAAHAKEKQRI